MLRTISYVLLLAVSVSLMSCGTANRATDSQDKNPPQTPGAKRPSGNISAVLIDSTQSPEAKVLINADDKNTEMVKMIEEGRASWYGPNFNGKLTANGEQYDMHAMTAAHRTLPFNTLVLVKNEDSGKTTLVRINDRGPYAKNRIIDLSHEAASQIGMLGPGTANVKLYVAKKALKRSKSKDLAVPTYTVQLGSFKSQAKAFNHSSQIDGSRVEIVRKHNHVVYRVYYGLFIDKDLARKKQRDLEHRNFSGFVKQIENG